MPEVLRQGTQTRGAQISITHPSLGYPSPGYPSPGYPGLGYPIRGVLRTRLEAKAWGCGRRLRLEDRGWPDRVEAKV